MKENEKSVSTDTDTTKYGEQIPSQFNWTSFEEQKKKAEQLEKQITAIR